MLAKFIKADECIIYTDVDGVYSSDPNKIPLAKKIDKISYEEMLELSSLGAKVMQSSAVQAAMIGDVPIQVKSTFTDRKGTEIINQENIDYTKAVTGVAYSKDDSKITLLGVEDKPGVAADVFEPLSKNQINVDMVIQNLSTDGKKTDLTFTTKRQDCKKCLVGRLRSLIVLGSMPELQLNLCVWQMSILVILILIKMVKSLMPNQ